MSLATILQRVTAINGVQAVVLAGRDGLAIAQVPGTLGEADALAAFGASVLSAAEGLGAETNRGATIGVVLEYGDMLISVDPLGELALTVSCFDHAAVLVLLRLTLRQVRNELLAELDSA
ncbi:MAG TPA: roadblock/LC7 domain-containing protein [Ktedonobacterales bacterium]|nr:roadblock/LC7 domain-containing protein [Ktedonobacterales bacterium]